MELIDKDKLDDYKFRSASERMDLPVDYMVGWNDAVDGIMCNAPAVEAIPISWLQTKADSWNAELKNACPEDAETIRHIQDNYLGIIEEWRKEK